VSRVQWVCEQSAPTNVLIAYRTRLGADSCSSSSVRLRSSAVSDGADDGLFNRCGQTSEQYVSNE
jgi:hypothetical protein